VHSQLLQQHACLTKMLMRVWSQGAQVAVYAATSPLLATQQPVPLFLHDCKPRTPAVRQCLLLLLLVDDQPWVVRMPELLSRLTQ
jgi:hypothetical protein